MVELNDESHSNYNTGRQTKFKTLLSRSSLCNYSDTYIPVSGTITVAPQTGDNPNNKNKEVVFKNCSLFTDCISKVNNTQIDSARDTDVVMPKYNLMEYSDNYSETQEVYGNTIEMNLPELMNLLFIFCY